MSPWINYHHLFYFKTIAEEGTVLRAAEKLRVGQPTLSAQLKQFEDALGVSLFDRHNRRLILTEQGRVALEYARNIFRMGSEMYEVIHDRLKPLKPSIHLGAIDSIPKQVIVKLVRQALKISPCQVTLSEGRSDELLRELVSHRIDLVVTNFMPMGSAGKSLYPKLIAKNPVEIYGGKKFKGLRKGFPGSISDQPIILPTYDSRVRQDIDHWAKLNSIELNIVVESQDISVKKLMASQQLGLIPTSPHSVDEQVDRGELVSIGKLNNVYEELYIVTANRKIENPIASKIRDSFSI